MEDTLESIQQLLSANRPTSPTGYAVPVRDRVGRFVRKQRDQGVIWPHLTKALGASHASLRNWMNAAPPKASFLPVRVAKETPAAAAGSIQVCLPSIST